MDATNFSLDVVERWRADNGEANQEHICLGVRERSKTVIIFLSSSIPESQADRLAIDHDTGRVVIEAADAVSTSMPKSYSAGIGLTQ